MNEVDVQRCESAGSYVGSCDTYLYKLEGRSMRPALIDGDLLILRVVSESSLRTGDIIAFHSQEFGKTVIHRVVGFGDDENDVRVLTRGDSSSHPDAPVRPEFIMGRVSAVIRKDRIKPCRRFSGIFWLHASAVLRKARRGVRWLANKAAPSLNPLLRKTCLSNWIRI